MFTSCLVVWIPLFLDPSDGVFGRFDLAALCGCRTLNFCLFVCYVQGQVYCVWMCGAASDVSHLMDDGKPCLIAYING